MTRVHLDETARPGRFQTLEPCRRPESALRLELEELDRRLEAAFLSKPDFHFHANEPCVWACACFLVDGSRE